MVVVKQFCAAFIYKITKYRKRLHAHKKISVFSSLADFLVIQHAPKEIMVKYLPLLREAAAKGEASNNHLAMMEDRVRMNQGLLFFAGADL